MTVDDYTEQPWPQSVTCHDCNAPMVPCLNITLDGVTRSDWCVTCNGWPPAEFPEAAA